jgi:hypothetical protein
MSVAIKAILDDPYFDPKFSAKQKALLRKLFHLELDKPH